jgi:hypothetical protein
MAPDPSLLMETEETEGTPPDGDERHHSQARAADGVRDRAAGGVRDRVAGGVRADGVAGVGSRRRAGVEGGVIGAPSFPTVDQAISMVGAWGAGGWRHAGSTGPVACGRMAWQARPADAVQVWRAAWPASLPSPP